MVIPGKKKYSIEPSYLMSGYHQIEPEIILKIMRHNYIINETEIIFATHRQKGQNPCKLYL